MRKILSLIFGVLIALPSIAQIDSMYLYDTMGDSILMPAKLFKLGATVPKLLKIGLRKAKVQNVNMGMDAMYIPETDLVGGNVTRSLAKLLTYQIPLSVQVSQSQIDSITRYIKRITEPVVLPKPDIITDIDNMAAGPANKYSLAWVHSINAPWNASHFANSASYTAVKDGALETTFDGYRVEWFTEKRVNHGIAAVSIDGGPEVMVDLFDPRKDNNTLRVWTSPVLASGTHTIKIRCTLTKSSTIAETDTNIIHDYFKVYKKGQ